MSHTELNKQKGTSLLERLKILEDHFGSGRELTPEEKAWCESSLLSKLTPDKEPPSHCTRY